MQMHQDQQLLSICVLVSLSSFNIRNIREISNDPLTKFTNQLAKKLSKFLNEQQLEKLENKEDVFSNGQDIDSILRFNNFTSTKYFDGTVQYLAPTEPDDDKCRVWIQGRNVGNQIPDISTRGNDADVFGDPLLIDGTPFDYGIHIGGTKSTAVRFNRPTSPFENREGLKIDHDVLIRASEGLVTGISFFIRFRVFDLAQQGGAEITLFEKTDNNPVTDGIKVTIDASGRLKVSFENSNTVFAWQTPTSTIVVNTVYDVWITYTKSGDVIHVYVNNVDQTLSSISALAYHGDLTNLDLNIFRRGQGSDNGFVYGDFYDFMMLREKVVSATEVSRHYTNKWTTANIPFGAVMISNYFAMSSTSGQGYTTTGFTTIGYDT